MTSHRRPRRIVLAFSGGLDTSAALVWLQDAYACPVVAFIADLGQGDETRLAAAKARTLGAESVHVLDLTREYAEDFVFPMYRANALYEGQYLMSPSIGRPLIAAAQLRVAEETDADAVAHGATGKGNDQVRFDLSYAALRPDLQVIVPWREWRFSSRSQLLDYADVKGIEVAGRLGFERPYSIDSNLLHTSYEGEALEDPAAPPPRGLLHRCRDAEDAEEQRQVVRIGYREGNPISVDGVELAPDKVIMRLDEIGASHGIGRLDIVENRIFGMKTRNVYEAPSGTLMWHAHRAVESLVLDPEVAQLKEELMPRYARMVYRGNWFAPERAMLQAAIDYSQRDVTGEAALSLWRGAASVIARCSPNSRYSTQYATFEEEDVFDQSDAEGWVNIESIRFRTGGPWQAPA